MSPPRVVCRIACLLLLSPAPATCLADAYSDGVQPFVNKYCLECHNDKKARGELNLGGYRQAAQVTRDFRRWSHIIEFIRDAEMPPAEAVRQPTPDERGGVVRAIEDILLAEARKHAGDPGVVLPRRLSNTEYDHSIRDLTGVDIRPTREFPADPAAGEGFDNTGEALAMSPSLLKKYLMAAQEVAHHLVLKTDGVAFAPYPVTSYNERKKLTEQAIIDFYQRHEVRVADYLEAAWRYRHRDSASRKQTVEQWATDRKISGKYLALVYRTLEQSVAGDVYEKQLGELWRSLPPPSSTGEAPPELTELREFVEFCRRTLGHREGSLIKSNAGNWPILHLDFRARVAGQRDRFDAANLQSVARIRFDRLPNLNKERKPSDSKQRMLYLRFDPLPGSGENYVVVQRPIFSKSGDPPRNEKDAKSQEVVTLRSVLERHDAAAAKRLAFGVHPKGGDLNADSFVVEAPAVIEIPLSPNAQKEVAGKHLLLACELDKEHAATAAVHVRHASKKRPETRHDSTTELLIHGDSPLAKRLAASSARICAAFPNRFFYVDDQRGLAAGFHLVDGFFRDDRPLVEKVLDEQQVAELDQLWEQLHFVTGSAETLLRGFVWFERSERHVLHDKRFDFLRPEDPKLVEAEMLDRFERVYLGKMGVALVDETLEAVKPDDKYRMIHGFFERIREGLARRRTLTRIAERQALEDLDRLAARAYRRPLRSGEGEALRSLYVKLRSQGQAVEASLRGALIAILMSPEFCYRYNQASAGEDVVPLTDEALASRLSYFLWSSLPDEQLLESAAKKQLTDKAVLLDETRRMLKDPKIEVFAREFFGQWLRYRDYLAKDPINGEAFAGYTDELKRAIFEEPVQMATDLIQNDRPITKLLNADATFVNGVLAKHYGGEIARRYRERATSDQQWLRVEGLRDAGRGGLFGMAVILTKNSRGERTSPVRRGFWTVHHLLGQHFPPPPTDVPELPPNEREAKKTIRELIVQHTANPQCAMCHKHFDSLGMTLEGFDATGRARTKDLAGRDIDDRATLPDGSMGRGVGGLIDYVEKHRQRDFVRNLCKKFLGYALGRSVVLSDQPLLREMEEALEKNNFRFSSLFETVVASRQFTTQRGRDDERIGD